MAIKATTWTLDTCGCAVEYTWDDNLSNPLRTHEHSKSVLKCTAHAALDGQKHYDTIRTENITKNRALTLALTSFPTKLGKSVADELGSESIVLKDEVNYDYSFSGVAPNRTLRVSFTGANLTAAEKSSFQSSADAEFGTDKVAVD